MTSPSRREQLADKVAESSFMRNVLGPKVVEPIHGWYETSVRRDGADTTTTHEHTPGDAEPTPAADTTTTEHSPDEPTPPTPIRAADTTTTHEHTPGDAEPTPAADTTTTEHPAGDAEPTPAADTSTTSTLPAPASASLAAAQSAEAFFAGPDAGSDPAAEPPRTKAPTVPEHGAEPPLPTGRLAAFKDIAMRVKARVKEHNLNVVAAGVAFWGLLAIPAVFTAVISIYGLVANPEDIQQQIDESLSGASQEVRDLLGDQLTSIASASGGGLAVGAIVGIVLALWTSSGAIAKVIATLNVIFGVPEDRKIVHLRGLALLITFGAIVGIGVAAFALAALPAVLAEAGLSDLGRWLVNIGRFPAMLVLMTIGLSVLYGVAPNAPRRLRIVSWGAVFGTVLWLIVSGVFSIYTATFADYNETYGAIGGIVVVLLWLFITAFMVLLGAEIDAARDERAAELKQRNQGGGR